MDRNEFLYLAKYYLEILPSTIARRRKAFADRRESAFIEKWDGGYSQNSSGMVKLKSEKQEQLKILQ